VLEASDLSHASVGLLAVYATVALPVPFCSVTVAVFGPVHVTWSVPSWVYWPMPNLGNFAV